MSKATAQKEILEMLNKEGLRPKEIAHRRGTTTRAVYKIIQKLKNSGKIKTNFPQEIKGGVYKGGSSLPVYKNPHQIRLHNVHIEIKILQNSLSYKNAIKKGNIVKFSNSTCMLHNTSISLYLSPSFYGDSPQDCLNSCSSHLNWIITKIENRYNLIISKPEYTNIRLCRGHFAEIQNGLSEQARLENQKVYFRCLKNNKVWLIIDNSYNLRELETVHSETALQDMMKLKPFFDDIRNNELPVLSDFLKAQNRSMKYIQENRDLIETISKTQNGILEILNSFLKPNFNNNQNLPNFENEPHNENPDYFG